MNTQRQHEMNDPFSTIIRDAYEELKTVDDENRIFAEPFGRLNELLQEPDALGHAALLKHSGLTNALHQADAPQVPEQEIERRQKRLTDFVAWVWSGSPWKSTSAEYAHEAGFVLTALRCWLATTEAWEKAVIAEQATPATT